MKALRIIGSVIVGIVLFGLIFGVSVIKSTQNFLEKDLILGLVKTAVTESVTKEANKLKDDKQKLIDEIFSDKETGDFVSLVFDNFSNYKNDKVNFKVSDSDVEKIYSYALKHKDQIVKVAGDKVSEISDAEFKEMFSSENINKFADKVFSEVSGDIGDGIDKAIDIYNDATSSKTVTIMIVLIVVCLILLGLINWSLYKWMLAPGVCLIVSGLLLALIYGAGTMINDIISAEKLLKETIGSINLTGYAILGAVEVVLGIILIVAYNMIDSRTLNQQIKELGTGK